MSAKLEKNIIKEKVYKFALHVINIKFVNSLPKNMAIPILGGQLLHASTSVGANVEEALGADSKKDFSYKMSI
ncbi:MAG: four helix bundle protein [bacterium]|nr:four helix bundle protein [bacterium]